MIGERVHIREHTANDIGSYVDWQTDPDVAKHVSWLPRTRPEAEASLRDAIDQQNSEPRVRYFFAVVLNDTQEMIGDVGYTITRSQHGGCGWFLRRKFWGNGYATEAVRAMIEAAFLSKNIAAFSASCKSDNVTSMRVMEKCGFLLERRSEDRLWYTLIRRPWEQRVVQGL